MVVPNGIHKDIKYSHFQSYIPCRPEMKEPPLNKRMRWIQ